MNIILVAGGERKSVEIAEAKSIVERFRNEMGRHNVVTGVDLSCRQWKQESLDEVEEFLRDVAATIRYVKIDDIIAGLQTEEGLSVTETLANVFEQSNLLEVNLSDNAMGPRGLGRVGSLFANSQLQRLYLSNCGLSHHSMIQLKDYLMADDGRVAKSLKELVLDKNMIGVEGAEQVAEFLPQCRNLELFSYRRCRPVKAGTKHIAQGLLDLATNFDQPLINHLDLEDCTFGSGENEEEDAIVPFSKAVAKFKNLRYLDMKDGEIEQDGLSLLVEALKASGAKLTHLLMDANGEFGAAGARILSEWLVSQATSIRCLHLNLNELGDDGVAIILEPFFACMNKLEDLSLEQNEIEMKGATALLRARLPHLKRLNLADNDDIPLKVELRSKFGSSVVSFGEDEDDEDVDGLVAKMSAANI